MLSRPVSFLRGGRKPKRRHVTILVKNMKTYSLTYFEGYARETVGVQTTDQADVVETFASSSPLSISAIISSLTVHYRWGFDT